MTEHEHDTELAPTAAPELAEQTTELPPANHAAATPEAWSLDDTAELDSDSPRRGRLVSVGCPGHCRVAVTEAAVCPVSS